MARLAAVAAPAVLYGPHWAALTGSFGLGGLLAGRIRLDHPTTAAIAAAAMTAAGLVLSLSTHLLVVIAAQIVLALLLVVVGIHAAQRLHDCVPSTVRAGVASGVSTLTWIAFLPPALAFGLLADQHGINTSGWIIVALTLIAGVLIVAMAASRTSPARCTALPPPSSSGDLAELATDAA